MRTDDSICGISSPPGRGAIAVIRISGGKASSAAKKFYGDPGPVHRLVRTAPFKNGGSGIDLTNYVFFKGPGTYTGEDMLEIYCHGGTAVQDAILAAIVSAGIRPAFRGEFTYRAVLNGKMDMLQAEAVNTLINANTGSAIDYLNRIVHGGLSSEIRKFKEEIYEILAKTEAGIDFSDSLDISDDLLTEARKDLEAMNGKLSSFIADYGFAKAISTGYKVAIAGKPNSGKSSLLNAILKKERAIVAEYGGTTRDIIREEIDLDSYDVTLYDTAGIRETDDIIEKKGILKTKELLAETDLAVFVADLSTPFSKADRMALKEAGKNPSVIVFLNKSDIEAYDYSEIPELRSFETVKGSALRNSGVKALLKAVSAKIAGLKNGPCETLIFTERQKQLLSKVKRELGRLLKKDIRSEAEICAELLKHILKLLNDFLGAGAGEDIREYIFKNFCIGK